MRKNIPIYIISVLLLTTVLLFFNKAYKELASYAELTNRHNTVYSYFQNLSRQINNAAILDPDLIKTNKLSVNGKLFFTDSLTIIRQLDLLKAIVIDTTNIEIAGKLDTAIKSELSWLLNNNVPDSFKLHKAYGHILSYMRIDSLINRGIDRTLFLISYRKTQVTDEIRKLNAYVALFITLSFLLLLYTTVHYFKQRSKIKTTENAMELVLNRIRDGVVSVDRHWRYTFLNDVAMDTHPFSKKDTIGKIIWDVHPKMKGTVFWDKYHEAMRSNKVIEIDSYYEPMKIWFSVTIYPSFDGLTIFYKDVTESRKVSRELQKAQKEISDYKFALDEANIVAVTNQKGIIQYVNNNFCKISQYSREELIGQDHRIINSGFHKPEFIRELWTTISNGRIWKGELKNRAKDGSIYWVDTTIVPFLDEERKPYQYIAIRSDATDRKNIQEKLAKSEKIYKTIASSIPGTVICILDRDYRYLLMEGDMIEKLGYSRDKILGNKAEDVLSPEIFAGVAYKFERAFKGETQSTESCRFGFHVITRYIPLKDENDFVYAIMAVAIDITELKKAQSSIAELNRGLEEKIAKRTGQLKMSMDELEAFSYSVSHDLRAPLRGIIGFSTILEQDHTKNLDSEGRRILSVIKKNTLKMGILIDDLLSFSRLGKQSLLKTRIDTDALISEIISELKQSKDDTAKIQWNIQQLQVVNADFKTYRQIWINLISNAVKYSRIRDNPVIEIGTCKEENNHVFFIRDNGAGFNEEYKNKLFKAFQRLHSANEFEGTGVGLAIVEKIVTKHGGKVWAEGKEGVGACFYFSLPK